MDLEKYLVSIGIKGQDIVLSTLDRIRKEKKSVQSPIKVPIGKGKSSARESLIDKFAAPSMGITGKSGKDSTLSVKSGLSSLAKESKNAAEKLKGLTGATDKTTGSEKKSEKETKNLTEQAKKHGKEVTKGVGGVGSAVASQDPTRMVKSLPNMLTTASASIPFLGAIISAAAGVINTAVDAATNALSTAKQTAEGSYSAYQRNAESNFYGKLVKFTAGAKNEGGRAGSTEETTGKYSPAERAQIIGAVSSSFGKIQQPLADVLSKFVQTGDYNTGALSRVAGGDWRSTGTDTGFFVQKLADSFGDLPPSIAQRFQASLLEKYGASEIQQATPEEKSARERNAMWKRADENQMMDLDAASAKVQDSLLGLNKELNAVQVNMLTLGAGVAGLATAMGQAAEWMLKKANEAKATIDENMARFGLK